MKKFIGLLLSVTLTLGSSLTSFAGTIPRVYLNDNKVLIQNSPFIENNTTYIPLRTLADNIGATLTWSADDSTFTMTYGIYKIKMRINNNTIHVNETARQLSAPAILRDGVTYVPVRFIQEAFNGEISYNQNTNEIFVKMELPKDGSQRYDSYGRLIRTTSLPSNASSFEYILNGVPNAMYDSLDFAYDRTTWKITPIEGKDYCKPINIKNDEWGNKENVRLWSNNFAKNLDLRLNVDYRTIGSEWVNNLLYTYPSRYGIQQGDYNEIYTREYTEVLNKYVQYMKDNHLIIEGDYYVEPSITYLKTGGYYIRCWVKFRIKSDKVNEAEIYQNYPVSWKTNTWYVGYVDMDCGTNNMGSDGSDLTIDRDNLNYGNVSTN